MTAEAAGHGRRLIVVTVASVGKSELLTALMLLEGAETLAARSEAISIIDELMGRRRWVVEIPHTTQPRARDSNEP